MRSLLRPAPLLSILTAVTLLTAGCASQDTGSSGTPTDPTTTAAPAAAGSSAPAATGASQAPATGTVTITDNHGQIEVPVKPAKVVALDNHVFATLAEWGVPLVAAPKGVMGKAFPTYTEDAAVADIGNHREPNLENIVAAQPDLIIGGYRFASHYDKIKEQNPQAVVIELQPREGEDLGTELKREIAVLGEIFDHKTEAAAIADGYDKAIAQAKDAYNGTDTVAGLIIGGGKIKYAAAGSGRSVGPVFPALGLKPAIEAGAQDATHGDDVSAETIAASKAEWLIVLDQDAAIGGDEAIPARKLLEESQALATLPAITKKQVIYLDPSFYLTEDIQSYTQLYTSIAQAFSAAK